jgi:hypothetical protein
VEDRFEDNVADDASKHPVQSDEYYGAILNNIILMVSVLIGLSVLTCESEVPYMNRIVSESRCSIFS